MTNESRTVDLRALLGPILISHQGCPPCRQFTPKLKEVYGTVNATRKQFEVVFISSDQSSKQFEEYFATMPWLALPFDSRAEAAAVAERFGIRGIPALVIIDGTGEVINANARGAVLQDFPSGSQFPWKGQADPQGGDGPNWKHMLFFIVVYLLLRYVFKVF